MLYQDKKSGKAFAKRFQVGGVTREKLYQLVPATGGKVVWFDVAAKQESMPGVLRVILSGRCKARIKELDFDMNTLNVSTRGAKGLTVTKWPVRTVTVKRE
jgi:topoisomerase-4 subunit A